ncbi:MAG: tetratricopeptide repeat protein [Magnetococcales bacterium]|nr:tetratricopeptide repeat protein [Magnetococcales bacterium]
MNKGKKRQQKKRSKKTTSPKSPSTAGFAQSQGFLQKAVSFHQSGKLEKAILWYKKSIKAQPDNAVALSNMGFALQAFGKLDEAVDSCQKAVTIQPNYAQGHSNLGNALKEQGKFDEASLSYIKAIAIKPDFIEAHYNLGNVYQEQAKYDDAVASYKTAISFNPGFAQAHSNLGNALKAQGKLGESILSYKTAIAHQPDYAEVYSNLGNTYSEQGKYDEAFSCFKKAIAIQPEYAEAYSNLGNTLQLQGKLDEGVLFFKKAISINPEFTQAYNNLGNLLQMQGKLVEAIGCYQKAVSLQPGYTEAYSNLGNALQQQGKLLAAVECYQKAVTLKPDYSEAYNNLGNALQELGRLDEAVTNFQKAIDFNLNYSDAYNNLGNALKEQGKLAQGIASFKKAIAINPNFADAHSNMLFCMNYGNYDSQSLFDEHKIWGEKYAANLPTFTNKQTDKSEEKLRIGFVSADFRQHSVSFFLEALFSSYNKQKLEFFCYSNSHKEDAVTAIFKNLVDGWQKIIGCSDKQVVEIIKEDNIDILVDLSGHTQNHRLKVFAMKPAPIQVTWLGYPNTTGLTTVDYRFTDSIADPTGISDQLHTEKLIRLENGFLNYQPPNNCPEVAQLPMQSNGYCTYASFNNLAKITPQVVKTWAQILNATPDSKLLIKNKSFSCPHVKQSYLDLFAKESIAANRLEFLPTTKTIFDHLSIYNKVDISLDTFPYNGTTTTCESLWMGTPAIVLLGDSHGSRVGASILTQVGMDSLIAKNHDDYIAKAISLAKDATKLEPLRCEMRDRMLTSPLCDAKAFSNKLENAFFNMWSKQ